MLVEKMQILETFCARFGISNGAICLLFSKTNTE